MLMSWWRKLTAPGRLNRGPSKWSRPHVEELEDRTLLSGGLLVTTLQDVVNAIDNQTSLREAVAYANSHPGSDTITFAPGLTQGGPATITLTQGQLSLTDTTGQTTIQGPGANLLTIDGNNASRVFSIDSGVTALVDGLTVAHGKVTFHGSDSDEQGGGVLNNGTLTVSNSTLTSNSARYGGAIYNAGTLMISMANLSGNPAGTSGGGIDNWGALTIGESTLAFNSAVDDGGGIDNNGTLTVSSSTLASNSANFGGGIHNNRGTLTVVNSTLAANSAGTTGGGIINTGTLTVSSSTLAGNFAYSYGGGGIHNSGTLTLTNTIVANSATGVDLANLGTIARAQYNLIGSAAGHPIQNGVDGNLVGLDPQLAPLGDNGGPTQTMALLPGSHAIDTGSNALAVDASGNPLTTDQRGLPRIRGGAVDIGAFEVQNTLPEFDSLTGGTISYGTPSDTLSGHISAGAQVPMGNVTVTVNQVTRSAPIDATGHFSVMFTTATLPASATPYTITYAYARGTGFLPVSDTSQSLTVAPAPLTIVVDSKSKVYGAANPTFTGTVTGILNNDDVTVNYATSASQFSDVQAGGYAITVAGLTGAKASDYSVDPTAAPGASVTNGTLTITPALTTVAVASSFNPALAGQVITFTVTVSDQAPGRGIPPGAVQFLVDGKNLGSPQPLSGGKATSPAIALTTGNHLVTATYLPVGGNSQGSSGSFTQKVNAVTRASLQSVVSQALASGAALTFWADPAHPGRLDPLLDAINALKSPAAPIALTIDLRGGHYPEHLLTPPKNVKVVFANGTGDKPPDRHEDDQDHHDEQDRSCLYRTYLEGFRDRLARL